ncbi:MAG: peptidase modulator of gyrase [Myxococcales bacterium]|nr:peptidase modulator of gyrase [Myxococcales bacterium]
MNKLIAFTIVVMLALPLPAAEPDSPVLSAMQAELSRGMARLKLKGYEGPYFLAYAVRDYQQRSVGARFGAAVDKNNNHTRQAWVEVRVGDYQVDNTSSDRELQFDLGDADQWDPPTEAPLDDDPQALRATLWLLTDSKYKRALAAYAKKRGKRATTITEDENLPSFSREPAAHHVDATTGFAWDEASLGARATKASGLFKQYPDLFEGAVKISGDRVTRWFVNSEGTGVQTERTIYAVHLSAATRAKDGMLLEHEKDFYGRTLDELPDDKQLADTVAVLAGELRALREAKLVDPYTGPAILMEEAAGVFFHETVGHRLEGERQNDEKEGRTFKGQVGRHVLPDFLSVIDDPTVRTAGALQAPAEGGGPAIAHKPISLNGWYTFDDEGVSARKVTLVDNGVLKDYLKSRTPITGSLRSNGHGRAEGTGDPMGRMANLFLRSTRKVSVGRLKEMLLEEVRRQGKPFGLIIRDITGGSTNTSNFGYQAFKGQPRLVYRVDAKTGAETLVRGVEMVGTPLTTVSRIVATSDTEGVFNGFCGAESGFVPVSTVAPAVLMSEIELQRTQKAAERPPLLPPPWGDTPIPSKTRR